MSTKVGINGFGRIGRQVFKAIGDFHPGTLEVVAVKAMDVGHDSMLSLLDAELCVGRGALPHWRAAQSPVRR